MFLTTLLVQRTSAKGCHHGRIAAPLSKVFGTAAQTGQMNQQTQMQAHVCIFEIMHANVCYVYVHGNVSLNEPICI